MRNMKADLQFRLVLCYFHRIVSLHMAGFLGCMLEAITVESGLFVTQGGRKKATNMPDDE